MVAKYIPGFATVAPPLAGTMRLGLPLFLAYSAIAALLWAAAPILLGIFFHAEVDGALAWLEGMGTGAVAVIAAVVFSYIGVKMLQRYMLIRFLRMVRISVDELRDLMRQEVKPIVLDVRSQSAQKLDPRRIPGAIAVNIAAPQLTLATVPPDRSTSTGLTMRCRGCRRTATSSCTVRDRTKPARRVSPAC
mgnify:CR=1 FL=1